MSEPLAVAPGQDVRIRRSWQDLIWEIRAIVDDGYVVYRIWHKEHWEYAITSVEYLQMLVEDGVLELVERSDADEQADH